jgi:hypothetical protein
MNLKDRTNLLKDSCARIPYGVKCQCLERVGTIRSIDTFGNTEVEGFSGSIVIDVSHVRPYLFPLSSMSEEQKRESPFESSLLNAFINGYISLFEDEELTVDDIGRMLDWFNKNHLDWRGLIPMGLAVDATGLNIY